MKHAILYWTKTGHSKKLARALSEALSIPAMDLKETSILDGPIHTLFLVSGIYASQSDPLMMTALSQLDLSQVSKVVLVTSCTSGSTPQDQVRKALVERSIPVAEEEFICKGSFLIFAWGRPNEKDMSKAVRFASERLSQD